MEGDRDNSFPVRVTGNFRQNVRYEHVIVDNAYGSQMNFSNLRVTEDGVAYLAFSVPSYDLGIYQLIIYENYEILCSDDGTQVTFRMDRPATVALSRGEATLSVWGMDADDALRVVREFTGLDETFSVRVGFVPDNDVPVGKAVGWDGSKLEDGDYHWAYVYFSLGMVGREPFAVTGPDFPRFQTNYGSVPDMYLYYGYWLGSYERLYITAETQGVGDSVWHTQLSWVIEENKRHMGRINGDMFPYRLNNSQGIRARIRLYETQQVNGRYQPVGAEIFSAEFDVPLA